MKILSCVVQRQHMILTRLAISLCVLALGACGGGASDGTPKTEKDVPTPERLTPSTITVETALVPVMSELPAFEDGVPRTISAVEDENGVIAMFVENEVWLSTNNPEQLASFLDRWDGEVIADFDAQKYKIANLDNQYLVRVNTADTDISELADDLANLQPGTRGDFKVSSQAAAATLAISAETARAGVVSGINWVGQGSDFRNRDIADSPAGVSSADPNAFSWPSHTIEGDQNTGVAEAWRALDFANLLTPNKVGLAILDMGFDPNADYQQGWVAFSNIPLVAPIGTENIIGCGENPCLWHGTNVLGAAMAVANNGFGSAGPAGPVARPVIIHTSYDFFTSIFALAEAKVLGAKIANMSYSAPVHITLSSLR
ncbi:hypothetical protein SAMN02745866_00874 [Alteromonadaceae bacterium Bs31]|nr:hypothetical protein SAMN02745866_00874 [Alteromonadaceae bacterium Bs31]